MKVKLSQAIKRFFGNSSLEMVYFEAVANALDAGADHITISLRAKAYNQPETIKLSISDNGKGFTDKRFKKFSNLFDVEETSHKGLGRLVYLCYFDKVKVQSFFDGNSYREFDFDNDFEGDTSTVSKVDERASGTIFSMEKYTLQKLAKSDYINPTYIKHRLLEEFYARFYSMKQSGKSLQISITLKLEDEERVSESFILSDIPTLTELPLDSMVNLIDQFHLYYSILPVGPTERSMVAAISVDNRTKKVDIISEENIPFGYDMVFLLYSDYFQGKVDASRQNFTLTGAEMKQVQQLFRKEVAKVIEENIPRIKQKKVETMNSLNRRFPHLSGYFDNANVGYLSRTDILKKAQDKFFQAQRELLDAKELTDQQYEKSLDLSARALTEYILFRQLTIDKLKKTTSEDSETELHRIFASMRKDGKFEGSNLMNDLYRNNAWLLDDKYMTYKTILSDRGLKELVSYITDGEVVSEDTGRPDFAFVFSNNPENTQPFDIVIVEIKKRGIKLEDNMTSITQLEKRARKLMTFYNNQIQRIWFYSIIDIGKEERLALLGEYTELYSTGQMFYKETQVAISEEPLVRIPIGVYVWDLDAVVNDAETRNSTFLELIRSNFKQEIN
jgi:hypothetical protein